MTGRIWWYPPPLPGESCCTNSLVDCLLVTNIGAGAGANHRPGYWPLTNHEAAQPFVSTLGMCRDSFPRVWAQGVPSVPLVQSQGDIRSRSESSTDTLQGLCDSLWRWMSFIARYRGPVVTSLIFVRTERTFSICTNPTSEFVYWL